MVINTEYLQIILSIIVIVSTCVFVFFKVMNKHISEITNNFNSNNKDLIAEINIIKKELNQKTDIIIRDNYNQDIFMQEQKIVISEKFNEHKKQCVKEIDGKLNDVWENVENSKKDINELNKSIMNTDFKLNNIMDTLKNNQKMFEDIYKKLDEINIYIRQQK